MIQFCEIRLSDPDSHSLAFHLSNPSRFSKGQKFSQNFAFHFRYRIPYVETSAVTGQGLDAGMEALLQMVMPSIEKQMKNGLRTKRLVRYCIVL